MTGAWNRRDLPGPRSAQRNYSAVRDWDSKEPIEPGGMGGGVILLQV